MPAAFIVYRICDAGRTNWVGEGDYLDVGQHYILSLFVLEDGVLPFTRVTKSAQEKGIRVDIDLCYRVRDPAFIHGIYAKGSAVIGRVGVNEPPSCREVPSDIPGLVTFKRIEPNVRSPLDCEGGGIVATNRMFALVTVSQIASASAESFFCRLT